ncbi:MAG: helix-turn-helix transcriptional regulator [Thermoplasmata archaeon]
MLEEYPVDKSLTELFGPVRGRILQELSYSSKSMEDLSELLGINKNAVKEHMDSLISKGYVKCDFRHAQAGRPKKVFDLTEKGMDLFPKRYAALASLLMNEIRGEMGDETLNRLLAGVAEKLVKNYAVNDLKLDDGTNEENRLDKLRLFVESLNKMGYSARLVVEGGSAKIVRYNCIFYDLAKENAGAICGSLGMNIVKGVVGEDFKIKEKFSTGDRKCVVELKL